MSGLREVPTPTLVGWFCDEWERNGDSARYRSFADVLQLRAEGRVSRWPTGAGRAAS